MYESFGNLTFSEGTPADSNSFRYTGREFDSETGLYYYRARYYDPEVGRFLSEDPIGFDGGINFYSYVGNNPINFFNPFGLHKILFDGSRVTISDDSGKEVLNCSATSGVPGYYPGQMWVRDFGPIPEGLYFLDPSPGQMSYVEGLRRLGRDIIAGDYGRIRVPLTPAEGTNTFGRDGFYLHGGRREGTKGCIDVGSCDRKIYDMLKTHTTRVPVRVKYTNFRKFWKERIPYIFGPNPSIIF